MTTWTSALVDTGDVKLRYQRAGSGRPLIFLHGMRDNGDCWKPFAAQLVPHYDVILLDARGHGESDKSCTTVAHVDQVTDLRVVIAQLQLVKPLLIGHSMGAMVAFIAACTYPELLHAVILEDPRFRPLVYVTESLRESARANVWKWVDSMQSMTHDALVMRCIAENPTWRAEELNAWAAAKLQLAPRLHWEDERNMVPWQQRMQDLAVPTLLISADESRGGLVTAESAAEARMLSQFVEIAHIRNVGHCIRREAPVAYRALTMDFVRRMSI